MELLLKKPSDQRPLFQVHPGISAFQLAAARIGAPLMQDFCSISLSDCLIPWENIEKRLHAAASSDFVVAIYNPRSNHRQWQVEKAIEIFLSYRASNTPVAIAKQLARKNEEINIYPLCKCPIDQLDMFSMLLIGNSVSYQQDDLIVTPRGYEIG